MGNDTMLLLQNNSRIESTDARTEECAIRGTAKPWAWFLPGRFNNARDCNDMPTIKSAKLPIYKRNF
jgi:hypothetical protein